MDRREPSVKHKRHVSVDEVTVGKKRKTETGKITMVMDRRKRERHDKRCATADEVVVAEKKRKTEKEVDMDRWKMGRHTSNLESNEKEKNLFICCASTSMSAIWYKIDPSKSSRTDANGKMEVLSDISPICEISSTDIPPFYTPVCLGSEIYMIGGARGDKREEKETKDVYVLQPNEPFAWRRKHSHLCVKRCTPKSVSTNGKIYVFESTLGVGTPKPWAEVFDPILDLWSPLPDPPFEVKGISNTSLTRIALVDDKIFMGTAVGLISFDVVTYAWDLCSTSLFDNSQWSDRPTLLDGMLFWFDNGTVYAYDLLTQKCFENPVQGLGILECNADDNTAAWELHMGCVCQVGKNSLCVVWEDVVCEDERYIRCIKFTVRVVKDSTGRTTLHAEVQTRASYRIRGEFGDCLAL